MLSTCHLPFAMSLCQWWLLLWEYVPHLSDTAALRKPIPAPCSLCFLTTYWGRKKSLPPLSQPEQAVTDGIRSRSTALKLPAATDPFMSLANETKVLVQEHKLELSERSGINPSPCTHLAGCPYPTAQLLVLYLKALNTAMHCILMLVLRLGNCFVNNTKEILRQL